MKSGWESAPQKPSGRGQWGRILKNKFHMENSPQFQLRIASLSSESAPSAVRPGRLARRASIPGARIGTGSLDRSPSSRARGALRRLSLSVYAPAVCIAFGHQATLILLPLYALETGGAAGRRRRGARDAGDRHHARRRSGRRGGHPPRGQDHHGGRDAGGRSGLCRIRLRRRSLDARPARPRARGGVRRAHAGEAELRHASVPGRLPGPLRSPRLPASSGWGSSSARWRGASSPRAFGFAAAFAAAAVLNVAGLVLIGVFVRRSRPGARGGAQPPPRRHRPDPA